LTNPWRTIWVGRCFIRGLTRSHRSRCQSTSKSPGEDWASGVRDWMACPRDACRFLPIRIRVEKGCNSLPGDEGRNSPGNASFPRQNRPFGHRAQPISVTARACQAYQIWCPFWCAPPSKGKENLIPESDSYKIRPALSSLSVATPIFCSVGSGRPTKNTGTCLGESGATMPQFLKQATPPFQPAEIALAAVSLLACILKQ